MDKSHKLSKHKQKSPPKNNTKRHQRPLDVEHKKKQHKTQENKRTPPSPHNNKEAIPHSPFSLKGVPFNFVGRGPKKSKLCRIMPIASCNSYWLLPEAAENQDNQFLK